MTKTPPEPECNGICLSAADIGLAGYPGVAYPHPACPAHGEDPGHAFELESTDSHGYEHCRCGAVRSEHVGQSGCGHERVVDGRCHDCGTTRN